MESKNTPHLKTWIAIGTITFYIIVLIIIALQGIAYKSTGENELQIIQSMIENLSAYQDEIESWGYQVSVLTLKEKPEDEALQRYYRNHCQPVLVLTNADGEMYCFYFGFDEYTSAVSYPTMIKRTSGEYEEALKTVRLELYKRNLYQAPFWDNPNEVGASAYYDVEVVLDVVAFSVDEGKEIWASNESGHNYTYYCSNNFVDCMRFGRSDPAGASRNADHQIKRECSAEQLLEFYQKGIALQKRLFELYYANAEVSSGVPQNYVK